MPTARTSPGVVRAAKYSYNDAGNVTAISDVSRSGTDTQCFSYDYLRRLREAWTQSTTSCATAPATEVVGGPVPCWQSYGYDTTGNRTKETNHGLAGGPDTVRDYSYPQAGATRPHALSS